MNTPSTVVPRKRLPLEYRLLVSPHTVQLSSLACSERYIAADKKEVSFIRMITAHLFSEKGFSIMQGTSHNISSGLITSH